MEAFALTTAEVFLLAATVVLFIIQSCYYLCLYNLIYRRSRKVEQGRISFNEEFPPLSVIICIHEDVEKLQLNLPAILEQDYPEFEVIVINDGNTEESEDYLTLLEEKYPHLYHSFIPASSRYISRKKLSLTLGIKASKHDWLVFTEADCLPSSNRWLRLMARNFTASTQVVLGYSGYERGKGWLHKQISFDNLFTSMRYLGYALAHAPYMGIGRNMAYRKELFYEQKGFSAHLNLKQGDDDLFINRVANAGNTRVETDPNAVMRMLPVQRSKEWREEKINHVATGGYYRGMQRYLSGGETTSRLLFHTSWTALTALGIYNAHWIAAGTGISLFFIRYALQGIVVNHTARTLNEPRRYRLTLPLFDLLQPIQSLRWRLHYIFRRKSDFMRK